MVKTNSVTGAMKDLSVQEHSLKPEVSRQDSPTESEKGDTKCKHTPGLSTDSKNDETRNKLTPGSRSTDDDITNTKDRTRPQCTERVSGSHAPSCSEAECKVMSSGQSDGTRTDEGFSETSSSSLSDTSPQHRVASTVRPATTGEIHRQPQVRFTGNHR